MERTCAVCGYKLIGRADKKFCNDDCHNTYNNSIKRASNNLIRNTNNQLRRNHRILSNLNTKQKTKIPKSKLLKEGFDFEHITGIYTTKTGSVYYYVYDQGYLFIDNDFMLLVKRDI